MTRSLLFLCLLLSLGNAVADELIAGRAAAEDGLHEIATRHLLLALEDGTLDAATRKEALMLLLESLDELERYDEILAALDGPAASNLSPQTAVFWRARALLPLGRSEEALTALESVELPTAPEWLGRSQRLKARCFVAAGRTNDAMQVLKNTSAALSPSAARAAVDLDWARLAFLTRRYGDADELLARVPLQESSPLLRQQAAVLRGRTLLALTRYPEAAALLASLGRDDALPSALRAEAWNYAAEAYRRMADTASELEALQQVITLAQTTELRQRAAFRLGIRELATGQLAAGSARLSQMIREAPGLPEAPKAQLALADALRESGHYEDALTAYSVYLETFGDQPDVGLAQWGRGWVLLSLERYSEAATAFLKAHDLIEGDAELRAECLYKAADAHFKNNQYASARDLYQQVVATFSDVAIIPRAALQAAECVARLGDPKQAEAAFLQVSNVFSSNVAAVEAVLRVGQLREARSDSAGAVSAYNRVISGTTNRALRAEAYLGRGVVSYRAYRFRPAYEDLSRAAQLGDDSTTTERSEYLRMLSAFNNNQDQEALSICEAFMSRFPQSQWRADALFWLGKYHFNEQQFVDGRTRFLEYVKSYPEESLADDALLWAGRCAIRLREYNEAIELFGRLAKEYPESSRLAEARFLQADAMCERAEFAEAIVVFDDIIVRFPRSDWVPRAWGRKGDCLLTLGAEAPERYEEAIEAYRAVTLSAASSAELVLQAEYKIGRCLEKMERSSEAFEQYYLNVMVRYLEEREKGVVFSKISQEWFARAAFAAADILIAQERWQRAVAVLERVVQVGGPGRGEARERIERMTSERRWLFR